ncbi:hypothetical protein BaRGS_00018020, partial [Batillaria attramentaria]
MRGSDAGRNSGIKERDKTQSSAAITGLDKLGIDPSMAKCWIWLVWDQRGNPWQGM